MYVVVVPGSAVTLAPVVALKSVPGVQVYVTAPEAVKVPLAPGQMSISDTVTTGGGLSEIVTSAVTIHPVPSCAVTV